MLKFLINFSLACFFPLFSKNVYILLHISHFLRYWHSLSLSLDVYMTYVNFLFPHIELDDDRRPAETSFKFFT